jgi:RNA polymerase-binding transcription factor DksA
MIDKISMREALSDRLADLREKARRIHDHQHNRGRDVPSDWPELAQFRGNDQVVDNLETMTLGEIDEIERALDRIDHGDWGTCKSCGGKISEARLRVMPTTTSCISCAFED